ncbi:MAG TPA: hypothetical protein VFS43_26065 [Polyangiaceae bacterium]|nr:hypothetical protein [Polyangiaceae bacterium]
MTTDFKAALQRGLSAHDDATRAEREVDEVLDELSRQLTEVVGSNVSVRRGSVSRATPDLSWVIGAAGAFTPKEKYPALVAQGPRGEVPLCEFELARSGYPVNVAFGDQQYFPDDRASLEMALARMLEDPVVAGRIRQLATAALGRHAGGRRAAGRRAGEAEAGRLLDGVARALRAPPVSGP